MGLLDKIQENYKTLSIVGMSKNAGKTTALNYLIEEAMDEGVILGITSTGRDGESVDLVTETEKPRIFLDEGTIVSVPRQLYELSEAGLEILHITKYTTAMGQLLICRVVNSGYVQIAGPGSTLEHKRLCAEMVKYGAELVVIDGAIDRKSIASPETSDAIILATGAVLSRKMSKVVDETVHTLTLYSLPMVEDEFIKSTLTDSEKNKNVATFSADGFHQLEITTGLGASKKIDAAITDETEWVYIPGALTESVLKDIDTRKFKKVKFVLKDPTKIFIDAIGWGQLKKRGFYVEVVQNIKVAAITVNPVAPLGYSFDHKELIEAMRAEVGDIPVVDVKYDG